LKDVIEHTSFNLVDSFVNILRYCRASFEQICGGGDDDSTAISEGPISVSANQKILKVGNKKMEICQKTYRSHRRGETIIYSMENSAT